MNINQKNHSSSNSEQRETLFGLKKFILFIKPLLKNNKTSIVALIGSIAIYTIAGRLLPLCFGYAIDNGILKGSLEIVWKVAGVYLFLEILRTSLGYLQTYGIQKIGNRVLFQVREKLLNHVQSLPLSYFDKTSTGRIITRLTNDVTALGDLFSLGITDIFINFLELLTIVIALFTLSGKLSFATLIISPLLIYISLKLSTKIRIIFGDAKAKLSMINSFTAETIGGIKILQIFNQTSNRFLEFYHLSSQFKNLNLKIVQLFALLWPILEFFNATTLITALSVGSLFRNELQLSLGELGAFILLLQSFFPPLRVMIERYTQFQNSLASADRIMALFDEKSENLTAQSKPKSIFGKIEVTNLSHRYSHDGNWALKDLNFTINPGESLAIVGRTGSGKTTFISLLQKLYEPVEGNILIDDVDLNEISTLYWRSKVGVVLQDNFILKGTVRSNISLSSELISDEKVVTAAIQSGCMKIFESKPNGLDTMVEEGGANLSVGERQLISFARVLAFDPEILILDEATSNIDSITEELIQKAIREVTKNRTSIIIAHRLSTITHCDRVAVFHNSKLVEIGSHQELIKSEQVYSELFKTQFNNRVC